MREKLIELLKNGGVRDFPFVAVLADHLIANGVTVGDKLSPTAEPLTNCQQWIPVTERLPDLIPCDAGTAYSEGVIVWTSGRKSMIAVWDGIDFLCAADYWEAWGESITHWMPLPEPPKIKQE